MSHRLRFFLCTLLACLAVAECVAAQSGPPALRVVVAGPETTVVSHAHDACERWDIPDAPARAVRVAPGRVLLFATHFRNRVAAGVDLRSVRHSCDVVLEGADDLDPARFDDRSWIASVRRGPHGELVAVLHTEFQGNRHPGRCPTGRYMDCWYNALTQAVSRDGGRRFVRLPGILAALPYRYDQVVGQHRGYFGATDIVARGDGLYMMTFATAVFAQRPGNCLLRTRDIADPAAWRAWDGQGFAVRFVDPYRPQDGDPAHHVCTPVGIGRLRWPVTSLVRHAPSGRYLAVMMDTAAGGGVYVSSSADLLAWSPPVLVLAAAGPAGWRCGQPAAIDYPSLLDPAGAADDFDTVSDRAWLFYTRFNPTGCRLLDDRDLVRVPVTLRAMGAPAKAVKEILH